MLGLDIPCTLSLERRPWLVDGMWHVRVSCSVLATQSRTQYKAKILFDFLPVISNCYCVCYREFQTEYLLCDCNILWMHRWVKERNITVRDTRCVYPKSLQAQPVTGVKQELLTCGKRERKTEYIYCILRATMVFLTSNKILFTLWWDWLQPLIFMDLIILSLCQQLSQLD